MTRMSISDALALARSHLEAGRLGEAALVCRALIESYPEIDEGYRLGAVVAHRAGDLPRAQAMLEAVIARNPRSSEAYENLAVVLRVQGQPEAAEAAARRALAINPDSAVAESNLGNALLSGGRLADAEAAFHRAIGLQPNYADAHSDLAYLYLQQRCWEKAEAASRKALEVDPRHVAAWINLAAACGEQGRLDETEAACERALEIDPNSPVPLDNLAIVLQHRGQHAEAEVLVRRLLEVVPRHVRGWNTLGVVLASQRRLEESEAACRQAVAIDPRYYEAYNNLGMALRDQGLLSEAMAMYERALMLAPAQLAAGAHSNLLFAYHYLPDVTPEQLREKHLEFDRRFGEPHRARWPIHARGRDSQQRLRLGLVSPDFHSHPVGRLIVRILEGLDPGQCETFAYSAGMREDTYTERIRKAVDHWRPVSGMGDDLLAEHIRSERIDILVDLAGHTGGNRLMLFARKPAPVQITWLGYEGTTGLGAMDYLLADRFCVADGEDRHHRERVLRLPEAYVCYDPDPRAPQVCQPPALDGGGVVFGSFNNLAKVHAGVIDVWSKILRRVPRSRLVLKYKGLEGPRTRQRFAAAFAERGIEADRLELLGWSNDVMEHYARIDVALDPFPFSGSLTTCDALWMGVPVVTWPRSTFASRHSLSHLSKVGLAGLAARDEAEYIELAVAWASDLPRLAGLRRQLRERMRHSPLCDGRRLADDLLKVLQAVWQQWLQRQGGARP